MAAAGAHNARVLTLMSALSRAAGAADTPTPDAEPRRILLRRILIIASVLLVLGIVVFAGMSVFAADPMAGT